MSPESETQALSIVVEHPADSGVSLGQDSLVNGQTEPPHPPAGRSPDETLGLILSHLLQAGVWIATALVFVGGLVYLARHGMEPADYHRFQGVPQGLRSPTGVVQAAMMGRRRGIIQLGLLCLIATPILRVLVSLGFFLRTRNLPYSIITGLVIAGLLYSLVGAYRIH